MKAIDLLLGRVEWSEMQKTGITGKELTQVEWLKVGWSGSLPPLSCAPPSFF